MFHSAIFRGCILHNVTLHQMCEFIVTKLKKVNIEAFSYLIFLSVSCHSAVVFSKHKQITGYRPKNYLLDMALRSI